jgi:hypothetical protein
MPRVVQAIQSAVCAMTLAGSALLGGCAGPAPRPGLAATPAPSGLEVEWWVVDDAEAWHNGKDTSAQVFRGYAARATPFRDETLALWQRNGVRVVAVPVRDLPAARSRLHTRGPIREQHFGQLTRWTAISRGTPWRGVATMVLDNGPLALKSGAMRLLVRCWAAPGLGDELGLAGLRLEIVPQHEESDPDSSGALRSSLGLDAATPREERGMMFTRLTASGVSRAGDAVVLIPESPDADWRPTPAPRDPKTSSVRVGAPIANSGTIGEAMLADGPIEPDLDPGIGSDAPRAIEGVRSARKVIVVLIPRAPERASLMP